ncbi:hypothetical protein VTN96DRAFT_1894 [Rasamsonia emersonii]
MLRSGLGGRPHQRNALHFRTAAVPRLGTGPAAIPVAELNLLDFEGVLVGHQWAVEVCGAARVVRRGGSVRNGLVWYVTERAGCGKGIVWFCHTDQRLPTAQTRSPPTAEAVAGGRWPCDGTAWLPWLRLPPLALLLALLSLSSTTAASLPLPLTQFSPYNSPIQTRYCALLYSQFPKINFAFNFLYLH